MMWLFKMFRNKVTLVSGDKNKVEWLFLSLDIFNVVLIGGHLLKKWPCSYCRTYKVVHIAGHQCIWFFLDFNLYTKIPNSPVATRICGNWFILILDPGLTMQNMYDPGNRVHLRNFLKPFAYLFRIPDSLINEKIKIYHDIISCFFSKCMSVSILSFFDISLLINCNVISNGLFISCFVMISGVLLGYDYQTFHNDLRYKTISYR